MQNQQNTSRVDAADVLRGVAVMGIILLHAVDRFNLFVFGAREGQAAWLNFLDRGIYDALGFVFGGKGYAIFALLFGFSFFIQERNQRAAGRDFRLRFVWRMALLAVIGIVDSLFYMGDILVFFAVMGLVLPLVCRLPDRAVGWIGVLLLVQPVELCQLISALIDPAFTPSGEWFDASYRTIFPVQTGGTFWEACRANLQTGRWVCFNWYITDGRITQTAALFLLGMLIGRRGLFLGGVKNLKFWFTVICWAAVVFFCTEGLRGMFPQFLERESTVLGRLELILRSYGNMAFAFALVGGILILFYTTKLHGPMMTIAPYGKMSLTNYLSQSIVGTAIFHHWGLGLWDDMGAAGCFVVGAAIVAAQIVFCRWWMRSHRQGPVEWLWKKATWIGK